MRRKHWMLGGMLLVGSLGAQAFMSDCDAPGDAPGVPDGSSADEAAMAESGQEVRGYVEATQAYLACLEAREAEMAEDMTDEQRAEIVEVYNTAVEDMQAVADDFNEQVRRYHEQMEE